MGEARGISLGTTLLVVALVAVLSFTLASGSVLHLQLSATQSNSDRALEEARSVAALAIARLLADPAFGKSEGPEDRLDIQLAGANGSFGRLSFDDQGPQGPPRSTNNLEGTGSREGSLGEVVAAGQVHLVGEGRCRGIVRRVEVMLQLPPWDYAVASSLPVRSTGGLVVGELPADSQGPVSAEDLLPADLMSNDSVDLGRDALITGDVEAVGEILPDRAEFPAANLRVAGELRSGQAPIQLPDLALEELDPDYRDVPSEPLADQDLSQPLQGEYRHAGDYYGSGQELKIDGGVIYVDGDLQVDSLSGQGLVIVNGTTTVTRGARILSDSSGLALLSQGKVTLQGTDSTSSFFRGLVYTEGALEAHQISLVGTLIQTGSGGEVLLDQARAILDRRSLQVEGGAPGGPGPGGPVAEGDVTFYVAGRPARAVKDQPATRPYVAFTLEVVGDQYRVAAATSAPVTGGTIDRTASFSSSSQAMPLAQLLTTMARESPAAGRDWIAAAAFLISQPGRDQVTQIARGGSGSASEGPALRLDLDQGLLEIRGTTTSQLLKLEDRIRIVLWRES